ncbi:hypothetical protein [Escherichia phage vB_EcoM-ZQ3]|uniref:Uncharacterized protein n=1 Tax=Escherichia phage vB_EcoM-ZQ3 TaxID=2810369 RepID=A0A8F3HKY0_9CAUD|nr:hypothetical protein [Escherichia phage vB_EcoM-ZQ3]
MKYHVYADFEANPSKDPDCRLLREPFDSATEAWHWIKSKSPGYMFFEVVDDNGALHPAPTETINFLLFAGYEYYPYGGIDDLYAKGKTVEALREIYKNAEENFDWYHIVNAHTFEVVEHS